MSSITLTLLDELKGINDLSVFFSAHEEDFLKLTCVDYLSELASQRAISIADIVKRSACGDYVYKIFKGERKASRDILICIALGMNLSLEECQLLLRISKFAILDSRDKRDSVIIYALSHSLNVFETDDLLDENNFTTLK